MGFRKTVLGWKKFVGNFGIRVADVTSTGQLRELSLSLEKAISEVSAAYDDLEKLLPNNEENFRILDAIQESYGEMGLRIADHKRELMAETRSVRSFGSHRSSGSRRTGVSNTSSHSSQRVKAVSEAASLQAKMRTLEVENEKRIQIAKLNGDLEMIKTQRDLEAAQAKLKAINEEEILEESPLSQPVADDLPPVDIVEKYLDSFRPQTTVPEFGIKAPAGNSPEELNSKNLSALTPNVRSYVPRNSPEGQGKDMVSVMEDFTEKLALSRLPPPEPEIFDGNPIRYPGWKAAFQILVERKRIPPEEKLFYLTKYLSKDVREAVKGFLLPTTDENAYTKAKDLLERRYGDSFRVASSFRERLKNWAKLPSRDGVGLREFTDFLHQCLAARTSIPELRILDDCSENIRLVEKLPEWLVHKWTRIVADHRHKQGCFPGFEIFVDFMERETQIANDPVFTTMHRTSAPHKSPKPVYKERKGNHCLATVVSQNGQTENSGSEKETARSLNCHMCDRTGHDLDVCRNFAKKSPEEKKSFMQRKGLCFGCLSQGHIAKQCKQRRKCRSCGKSHPTAFHIDPPREKPAENSSSSAVSHFVRSDGVWKSTMIVPVWVHHKGNPEKKSLVYAMLDTQSDTTFITDETYKELGISGVSTKLRLSTMSSENETIPSTKIDGLVIRGFNSEEEIKLPPTFSREVIPANRSHIPSAAAARKWSHLKGISDEIPEPNPSVRIGLLIGYNCPRALVPQRVIVGDPESPYGLRTPLGWSVVGATERGPLDDFGGVCHRLSAGEESNGVEVPVSTLFLRPAIKEVLCPQQVLKVLGTDFSEQEAGKAYSVEDTKFIKILEAGITTREDGHFEMPLPLRDFPPLPNNRQMALRRLEKLKHRLQNDRKFKTHYTEFMEDMIAQGYAEPVPGSDKGCTKSKEVWYIPHHGVYHPKKPNKIRVVFDASATQNGVSLNKRLLQGPDLTNSLIGVLCRFRKEAVAVSCDVKQMFYQFGVSSAIRDLLRFFWWENSDLETPEKEYRMTVHLFGATSSPGCANFGMRKLADESAQSQGLDVSSFIKNNFYVDDGLASVKSVEEAVSLLRRTSAACSIRGLKLHKFISNKPEVLQELHESERPCEKNLQLGRVEPLQRTLGICWNTESDCFEFDISLSDVIPTRRGILSAVSSIYDPLGFLAPVTLEGKLILQEMCKEGLDWDSSLPDNLRPRWNNWISSLRKLKNLQIPRCYKPSDFGEIKTAELHHFSDASSAAYGQCSYLRLINEDGHVHCAFVMGKSRVSPLKSVTIPRLELTAALVSVNISALINEELQFSGIKNYFWTDSQIALSYIGNDAKRFHVFVANRVQQIRDSTTPEQWHFVQGKDNPADEASRGMAAHELTIDSRWMAGPSFLWERHLPSFPIDQTLNEDDSEVKVRAVNVCEVESYITSKFTNYSSLRKITRIIALCLRWSKRRRAKGDISVDEINHATTVILRLVQADSFHQERDLLAKMKTNKYGVVREEAIRRKRDIKKTSNLYRLDPFLDQDGLIRVGGRIKRADMPYGLKHPVILPRDNHMSNLIIHHIHQKVHHQGRAATVNGIRDAGYWIIGCSSAVSRLIRTCTTCRRLFAPPEVQMMADLPEERLEPSPPFTHCGMDLFGPFLIKEGRRELKRYGVLFTCLASRAVHIETAVSLETDSFLNSLRRVIAIRGPVRSLRCDRGSNFVGAERELVNALRESKEVKDYLTGQGCQIEFVFNPPHASHMGGIWERQIRSARRILSTLLHQSGTHLDDESLRTFCCEAAAIINSRPLTVENLNDPLSVLPISPNRLLTMKSGIVLPPPGSFDRPDLYARKRWRRVQYIANEFWHQWKREFLCSLQMRQKWNKPKRNFETGDLVLLMDQNQPRNAWPLARVDSACRGVDGMVRKVKLTLANPNLDAKGKRLKEPSILERPIHKLILLVRNGDTSAPSEQC